MAWDIQNFLQQLNGGFEAGQLKRDEQDKINQEQQNADKEVKDEELKQLITQSDLEFKQKKNQIDLLQKLVKLFDSGKKKKKADGTEIDEPNPILEMLKKNFTQLTSMVSPEYSDPVENFTSEVNQENPIPQEYQPEPQPNPYEAPIERNSVATTTNDIVGKIASGGKDYLNSGNLEDYLKRYLQ